MLNQKQNNKVIFADYLVPDKDTNTSICFIIDELKKPIHNFHKKL